MTLFDRVCHAYIRQLANRSVSVKHSKLNMLVRLFMFGIFGSSKFSL